MRTVFPTPAPPRSPIFPPLAYGANKSITFIPVSSTSTTGLSVCQMPEAHGECTIALLHLQALLRLLFQFKTLNSLGFRHQPEPLFHFQLLLPACPCTSLLLGASIMQRTLSCPKCAATSLHIFSVIVSLQALPLISGSSTFSSELDVLQQAPESV